MNDRQLLALFDARLARLESALHAPRPWLGRDGILERARRPAPGALRATASSIVLLLVLVALIAAGLSLGVGQDPTRPVPAVVSAPESAFPAPFLEAGPWQAVVLVDRPGAPTRYPTLDTLVAHLRTFLAAGIKVSRPGAAVMITVPDGAPEATEVHLFATVIGGATDASSGYQFRIVAYRDGRGWWFDADHAQSRSYCDLPMVYSADGTHGIGMCLGSADPDRSRLK
jgi:hypothetical protein